MPTKKSEILEMRQLTHSRLQIHTFGLHVAQFRLKGIPREPGRGAETNTWNFRNFTLGFQLFQAGFFC